MMKTSPQTAGESVGRVGKNSAAGEAAHTVCSDMWLVEIPPIPEKASVSSARGIKD